MKSVKPKAATPAKAAKAAKPAKPVKAEMCARQPAASKITWADNHKVGVAKGVDQFIVDQLRAHFNGECCEVGMYLAMSRQADRDGLPEIAEAYKRVAFEEAEHAARFAEMLGEVVSGCTKTNLAKRVEAECDATSGKLGIALHAKKLGLDAIHDAVHEMCKDEARHGRVFEGLLDRFYL